METEKRLEAQPSKHPAWGLFQQSLSEDTPPEIVEVLHQYYEARIKALDGDKDGAKEIYEQINPDLLNALEEDESGDINFIGLVLTGTNVFDAPNKAEYFDKAKLRAILPKRSDPSSN